MTKYWVKFKSITLPIQTEEEGNHFHSLPSLAFKTENVEPEFFLKTYLWNENSFCGSIWSSCPFVSFVHTLIEVNWF